MVPFQSLEKLKSDLGTSSNTPKLAENNQNVWWGYYDPKSKTIRQYSIREKASEIYLECSAPIGRDTSSFYEECLLAAKKIRSDFHGEELSILLSGGLDSLTVLHSFALQGIKTKAYIGRFVCGSNGHDIAHAIATCEALNVCYEFIDIDIHQFFSSQLDEYTVPLKSVSPQLAFHYWLIDQVPGVPILGEGRVSPRRSLLFDNYSTSHFFESYGEKWGSCQWMVYRKRSGVPKFFRYTSELEYAYANDVVTQDFILHSSKELKIRNFKYVKPYLIQRHFDTRYLPKYTGFEKILKSDQKYRSNLELKYPSSLSYISYPWDLFLSLKKGEVDRSKLSISLFSNELINIGGKMESFDKLYDLSSPKHHYIVHYE